MWVLIFQQKHKLEFLYQSVLSDGGGSVQQIEMQYTFDRETSVSEWSNVHLPTHLLAAQMYHLAKFNYWTK